MGLCRIYSACNCGSTLCYPWLSYTLALGAARAAVLPANVREPIHGSALSCRFSYNWIKLRAWQLTEYDALLMLDSDMTVVCALPHGIPPIWSYMGACLPASF